MKNLLHVLSRNLVFRKNQTRFAKAIPAFALGLSAFLSFAAPHARAAVASGTIAVAAGSNHSLFVTSDGKLYAMGYGSYGQLGFPTLGVINTPVQVTTSTNVTAVAAGGNYSLFVTSGTLYAMGDGLGGQLGIGDALAMTPTPVISGTNVIAVAAGSIHSLFVTSGTLYAMGYNSEGELGIGTNTGTGKPTPVISGTNVTAVAAGYNHSLFVANGGKLYAMGYNFYGQLGTGTSGAYTGTNAPVQVPSATNVKAVAAGYYHSLYVTNDGKLYAMGSNGSGQLGTGTSTGTNAPVEVFTSNTVIAVAAGSNHSLFVTSDGKLYAMGSNGYGQLGTGTTTGTNKPTQVTTSGSVIAVAASAEHSLYATSDGKFYAMGKNSYYQLGDGTNTERNTPVQVGPYITKQPVNATVTAGSTATFTVSATSNSALTYQWQKMEGYSFIYWLDITGATTSTLTLTNVTTDLDGTQYRCVATNAQNISTTSHSATLTVNKGNQAAFSVANLTTPRMAGDTATASASGGSGGGAITWASNKTTVATINTTTGAITYIGEGTVTFTATKAGDTNYNAISATSNTVTVNKRAVTLVANTKSKTYGAAEPTYDYTVSSSTPLLSGDTIANSFTGSPTREPGENVGTYAINQGGVASSKYNITWTSANLTITKANQEPPLSVANLDTPRKVGDTATAIASGGSGGGAVTWVSNKTDVATINTTTGAIAYVGVGTVTFTATKAGDSNYNGTSATSNTVTVTKGDQEPFSVANLTTPRKVGDTATAIASGGTGGGAITWVSNSTAVATINTTTGAIAYIGVGTVTFTATKAGGTNYNDIPATSNTVTVDKGIQTALTFATPAPSATYTGASWTYNQVPTGGTGGGAVTYELMGTSTGAASLNPSTGIISNATKAGTFVVQATKSGGTNYIDATATYTLTLNEGTQAPLSVTGLAGPYHVGQVGVSAGISGGSGTGEVSYLSSNSDIATIASSGAVTFHAAGTFTVTATKAGDDLYNSITSAATSPITVNAPVNIPAVPGVTAPARNATAVTAITETAQYTGTVSWSPALASGKFAASTQYTASITLTAKSGCTFSGVPANFFTVASATSVTNAANSGVVTAAFPTTDAAPVDIAAIPGVTPPVLDAIAVTNITETTQYTGTVSWTPALAGGKFAANTQYTATINLTAKTGWTFTGVPANFFAVAGATSATNPADSGTVTAEFLATQAPPAITTHPANQTVNVGDNATFTIIATGNPAPGYQWQSAPTGTSAFTNITGNVSATTATLTLTNAAATMNGARYHCIATNSVGSGTSNTATLTVIDPALEKARQLKTQLETPGAGIVTINDTVDFSLVGGVAIASGNTIVGADASATISGNVTIPAGSTNVAIEGVTFASGSLDITGASGVSVTNCTFIDAPVSITGGADAVTFSWNDFTATGTGSGSAMTINNAGAVTGIILDHNLWGDGLKTAMPLATNARVNMFNNYFIATANTNATIAGAGAQILSVNNIYQDVKNPLSQQNGGLIRAYDNFTTPSTAMTVSGTDTVFVPGKSQVMQPAGIDKPGADDLMELITAYAGSGTARYPQSNATARITAATVSGSGASANTAGAVVPAAGSFTLTASASSFTPAAWQWYRNNFAIAGASAPQYEVKNALAAANAGAYSVALTTSATDSDIVTAGAFTVTVGELAPPVIITPPLSQTITAGANVTFTVVATGEMLTYQWKKGGADIPGATSANHTITNAQSTDAASYTVVVSNPAKAVTSNPATLTVIPTVAPVITTPPLSQTVTAGANVTFTVVASGNPAPTYQWMRNNTNIPGATNASYTITNAQQQTHGGSYTVRVSNTAGDVTSNPATLTVNSGGGGGGGATSFLWLGAVAALLALRRKVARTAT